METKEEYIYFEVKSFQQAVHYANWFAEGGFTWMYKQNRTLTMKRIVPIGEPAIPTCPDCGVPMVVDAKNHAKHCPTYKPEQ